MRCNGLFAPLGTFYTLTDVQNSLKPWLRPFLTLTAKIRSLILGYAWGNLLPDKILANYGVPIDPGTPKHLKRPFHGITEQGMRQGKFKPQYVFLKTIFS